MARSAEIALAIEADRGDASIDTRYNIRRRADRVAIYEKR